MRFILYFSVIIDLAFTYWSCKSNSNAVGSVPLQGSSSYFPLAVGDSWTYNFSVDSSGVQTSSVTFPEGVVNTEQLQGYTAYGIGVPGTDSAIVYYAFDSHGNLLQFDDTSLTSSSGVWAPLTDLSNTVKNSTVTLYVPLSFGLGFGGGPITPYNVIDTVYETFEGNTMVSVPAGTFNAAYYRDSVRNAQDSAIGLIIYTFEDKYYAQGVGLIKESSYNVYGTPPIADTSTITNEVLVSYSLK